MPNDFDDVGDFHRKFGLPVVICEGDVSDEQPGPREVDPELLLMRANFLLEELMEFMEACDLTWAGTGQITIVHADPGEEAEVDHGQAFDALIDLVYVAMGTAHLFGYPWHHGWRLVQNANMAKVRAQADASDSKRGSSYDVVKPPGWTPPDIEGLLRYYGWDQM